MFGFAIGFVGGSSTIPELAGGAGLACIGGSVVSIAIGLAGMVLSLLMALMNFLCFVFLSWCSRHGFIVDAEGAMVWYRAASVGTKVENLVSELSFLSCSCGFHSVVASQGRAVGVGVELSDVSLMLACGGGLLLYGGCSVMVGAVEVLVGSGVGCDLQLVTVASRYREHVDDRYHQSICRSLEHFRGPSMNEGGVTEALAWQRPLVVASPSILAPDQAVGISHHDGSCGSRSPKGTLFPGLLLKHRKAAGKRPNEANAQS